jgi:tetratricopeptide (TPR) repeat protein
MRLTSSYTVFRAEPDEQVLARARWHGREGRFDAAEREYRVALEQHPDLVTGWLELFELVRHDGRFSDALAVAEAAAAHFGAGAAVPLALTGAALAELGRTREAVRAIEAALEREPNLALAWHELAYTAYRVGEYSRALLALDRAFALEPHTDSLMLRGRILRAAGQYEAAQVAFEGAAQSALHEPQRGEAERELRATGRAATLGARPRRLSPRQQLFVASGAVVLEPDPAADLVTAVARALAALPALAHAIGWRPAAVAGLGAGDGQLAEHLAAALGAHPALLAALDPADQPLIAVCYLAGGEEWSKQCERLARWGAGTTFALVQAPAAVESADVVATVRPLAGPLEATRALAEALAGAEPVSPAPADLVEPIALATNAEAPWRRRLTPEPGSLAR